MHILLDDAIGKITAGVITCEEVLRVLDPQNAAEIACPFCGRELARTCPQSNQLLARDWRHCARCGVPLSPVPETP